MPFIIKGGSSNFKLLSAGSHIARCSMLIDLGTQAPKFEDAKARRQVYIAFEVPGELMDDGRPITIGQRYTHSTNERSVLAQHLEAWRGKKFTPSERKSFDIEAVLGKPCMISVIHVERGDKTYANLNSISAVPAGVTCPPAVNPPLMFNLEEFNSEAFERVPDTLKRVIELSPEYAALAHTTHTTATADDDIPF